MRYGSDAAVPRSPSQGCRVAVICGLCNLAMVAKSKDRMAFAKSLSLLSQLPNMLFPPLMRKHHKRYRQGESVWRVCIESGSAVAYILGFRVG